MKNLFTLGQKLSLLVSASLILAGLCFGQDRKQEVEWTWKDKAGRAHNLEELTEILRKHSEWGESGGKEGQRADLRGANLEGANFQKANLQNALLSEVTLTNSDLSLADLAGADLRNALFRPAPEKPGFGKSHVPAPPGNLTVKISFEDFPCSESWGGSQRSAILMRTNLAGADLSGARLDGANLDSSNLNNASLKNASLIGALLESANLTSADLTNANLENAIFNSADMKNSQLAGANVTGVELCWAIFEPRTLPTEVRGLASVIGLDLVSYGNNPDALVQLRKQFKDGGFEEQERKVTYAIKRRQADMLRRSCSVADIGDCIAFIFNRVLFDATCRYGMAPGHALTLCLRLWLVCTILYFNFIHSSGESKLYRVHFENPEFEADPSASKVVKVIRPSSIKWEWTAQQIWAHLVQEVLLLRTSMFFSLMSTFNIGFREINFGRWLRLLSRHEFDLKAVGWARVVSGCQALISVLLIALFTLTYFGRPFG